MFASPHPLRAMVKCNDIKGNHSKVVFVGAPIWYFAERLRNIYPASGGVARLRVRVPRPVEETEETDKADKAEKGEKGEKG